MKGHLSALAVLALASGCYLQPSSVKNPPPSADGVAVSLLGQDCEDHRGAKGEPVTRDLGVKVRIDNPTAQILRISEESVRLLVDNYSGGVRFPTVVEVQPHGTMILTLDFTHHALCEPDRQFVVSWNDAFVLDNRPITVANLAFHP
jgi:hypothetical protein